MFKMDLINHIENIKKQDLMYFQKGFLLNFGK